MFEYVDGEAVIDSINDELEAIGSDFYITNYKADRVDSYIDFYIETYSYKSNNY